MMVAQWFEQLSTVLGEEVQLAWLQPAWLPFHNKGLLILLPMKKQHWDKYLFA